jgi:hypothetical protein
MKKPQKTDHIISPAVQEALIKAGQDEREEYKPTPRIKAKAHEKGRTNMTFFMSISTHRRLRELALMRGISMQQLVAEFVDKGLAGAGEPTFKFKDEK